MKDSHFPPPPKNLKTSPSLLLPFPEELVREGRKPLERDDANWAGIVKRFHQLYGPVPQREGAEPLDATEIDPKKISCHFAFDAELSIPFLYSHVEILLNQCADLLDRCDQVRRQWWEKAAKAASLALDIADFLQNDSIHKEEIAAGIYTLPFQTSWYEAQSNLERQNAYSNFLTWTYYIVDELFKETSGHTVKDLNSIEANRVLTWLPFMRPKAEVTYDFDGKNASAQDFAYYAGGLLVVRI